MTICLRVVSLVFLFTLSAQALGQSQASDDEALRMAAVEALITAPPERALPLARKVLQGNYSDDLKERALFVLSQINQPEAQNAILSVARDGSGELRYEAVRMIGIGGNEETMAQLRSLYDSGDEELREAVLEAYLIAGDEDAIYQLAVAAQDEETFSQALEMLGAMGAHDKIRQLRDESTLQGSGVNEAFIEAYAIAGDFESLSLWATDASDPDRQAQAIEGLGIVGGESADALLVEIFRDSNNEEVREAAAEALMISGNDEALLELYRGSASAKEKKELLEYLVILGSDEVWQLIDQALVGEE